MVKENGNVLCWCDQGESKMMLEWAAEEPKGITMTTIDLEFLPADANKDSGPHNLKFVLQLR